MQLLVGFDGTMRSKNLIAVKRFCVDFIFWFSVLKCCILFHAFMEWEKDANHHDNKLIVNYNHLKGKLITVNDTFQVSYKKHFVDTYDLLILQYLSNFTNIFANTW